VSTRGILDTADREYVGHNAEQETLARLIDPFDYSSVTDIIPASDRAPLSARLRDFAQQSKTGDN
jgi:hypothetical protein